MNKMAVSFDYDKEFENQDFYDYETETRWYEDEREEELKKIGHQHFGNLADDIEIEQAISFVKEESEYYVLRPLKKGVN